MLGDTNDGWGCGEQWTAYYETLGAKKSNKKVKCGHRQYRAEVTTTLAHPPSDASSSSSSYHFGTVSGVFLTEGVRLTEPGSGKGGGEGESARSEACVEGGVEGIPVESSDQESRVSFA